MHDTTPSPETKGASDIGFLIEDLHRAFESYKADNDRRLGEIESRGAADVVTTDKLARIDRFMDSAQRRID